MKIGITCDLRSDYLAAGFTEEETAEFDSDETIDALEEALQSIGFLTERIGNIRALAGRLVAGERWDLVFNIAEGLKGFGREAQIPALLEAWEIPFVFSDPLVLALTLHKGLTKRVVRDMGIPTPDFAVIDSIAAAAALEMPFPLFAKPVAEGTGKGISSASRIDNREQLEALCAELLTRFQQPVLVETFLPGREFTVGIIGTGDDAYVPGVMEVIFTRQAGEAIYSFANKEGWKGRIEYNLVDDEAAREAAALSLAVWRSLGCRDGGRVDLRADSKGRPCFIEVNPLAGLRPGYSDLPILCERAGIPYRQMIVKIVQSALNRLK